MSETIESGKASVLLADSVSSVFADMAFIDVQEVFEESAFPEDSSDERCVTIDVLAPLSCRIELRINQALRDKIVENLFGSDPDLIQKKKRGRLYSGNAEYYYGFFSFGVFWHGHGYPA